MTLVVCARRLVAALGLGLATFAAHGAGPVPVRGDEIPPPTEQSDVPAPLSQPQNPLPKQAARPAWVDAPADYSGPIHRIPVSSGPYATPQQARQALDQALQEQLAQYVATQLGDGRAGAAFQFPAAMIRQRWVPPDGLFEDTVSSSVGPMHRAFARLELGPELRRDIERRWRGLQSRQRLVQLGAAAGAVLGWLASVHLGLGWAATRRRMPAARLSERSATGPWGWLRWRSGPAIVIVGCALGLVVAAGAALWLSWWLSWQQ